MISYEPLFKELVKKGMKIENLAEKLGIQGSTLKMALLSGKYISLKTLDRICKVMNCKVEKVIEYSEGEHKVIKPDFYCKVNWEAVEKKLPVSLGKAGIDSGHGVDYYKVMKRRGRAKKGVIKKLCDKYGIDIKEVVYE